MAQGYRWIAGVQKIGVLRANALGDFVLAQPALHALRAAYPLAEIVLLGKAWHAGYLAGRPGPVNRVVVVPRAKGVSEPDTWPGPDAQEQAEIDRFFDCMQAERFDLAVQMHGGGGNSNPFLLRLGAKLTVGMKAPNAPPLDRWIPYVYFQHEVLRLLEVAGLVGAPPVVLEPFIEVTPRDRAEAQEALPGDNRPLALLHPGASDPRRRWPAENFARAADALFQAGCEVGVLGVVEERAVVDAVIRAARCPVIDLCGRLSLHGLTGLIDRAALLIANDSGPRHLAEAVGTPTVGLFWCGNVINAGPVSRAFHRPHLSWRLDCPVCGQNTLTNPCEHQASFMDWICLDEVIASALDLVAQGRSVDPKAVHQAQMEKYQALLAGA